MLNSINRSVAWKIIRDHLSRIHGNLAFLTNCSYEIKMLKLNKHPDFYRSILEGCYGERGTGNRERESGNECIAVIRIRIQNGGRNHGKGSGN